jgi:hypothetical protein
MRCIMLSPREGRIDWEEGSKLYIAIKMPEMHCVPTNKACLLGVGYVRLSMRSATFITPPNIQLTCK